MKCDKCNGTGRLDDPKTTGLRLRKARLKINVGLREMARKMNISHSYLSQLESGQRNWSFDLIHKYQQTLNTY